MPPERIVASVGTSVLVSAVVELLKGLEPATRFALNRVA